MSLSERDRQLLQRCIDGAPGAWQEFVDRFLGLVVHVANHTAETRGLTLDDATRDDLAAEVFYTLLASDRVVLRRFRRDCSLATYLTVVARRVIARRLFDSSTKKGLSLAGVERPGPVQTDRIESREEVERLMARLGPEESEVVRMYHIDGKSYREISEAVGIAENSIGPLLSRARQKMREGA